MKQISSLSSVVLGLIEAFKLHDLTLDFLLLDAIWLCCSFQRTKQSLHSRGCSDSPRDALISKKGRKLVADWLKIERE